MLNCTGEKGQCTPPEVYGLPSQAAISGCLEDLGSLLLPGNGLLTQQSATTAPGGCQHQQMLYLQHAQDDPALPPLPSYWQGGETVVKAAL